MKITKLFLDRGRDLLQDSLFKYVDYAFFHQWIGGSEKMVAMLLNELIQDPHQLYTGKTFDLKFSFYPSASLTGTNCFEQLVDALPQLPGWSDENKKISCSSDFLMRIPLSRVEILLDKALLDSSDLFNALIDIIFEINRIPNPNNILQEKAVMLINALCLVQKNAVILPDPTDTDKYYNKPLFINRIGEIWKNRTRYLSAETDSDSKNVENDDDNNNNEESERGPSGGSQWKKS